MLEDLSYLRPKSQQFLNKYSHYYIKSGTEGGVVRNIYEKVDYDDYELNLIEEFKKHITASLPNNWKTSDYLKILVSADFQIPVALKNLTRHLAWLNQYNTKPPQLEVLQRGDFYIFGFDKQSRPVIIIRWLENDTFDTLQYLLESIKRQVLVPYFVENWTIIVDQQNYQFNYYECDLQFDFALLQSAMINFCGNLNAILFVNTSLTFQELVRFVPNKQQIHSKLKLISKIDDLQQYIPADQLEERYGGECFNLTSYWPPQKPKTNELLKQMTLDCFDESQSQKRLIEFQGRQIRKFRTLGRMQGPKHTTISNQHVDRTSSHTQSSHLKIVVREENGNQLMQEEIEIQEDDDSFEDIGDTTKPHQQELTQFQQEPTQARQLLKLEKEEQVVSAQRSCCTNSSSYCNLF